MKSFLIAIFLFVANFIYSQDYLNVSTGFNNNYAFFINSKVENKRNLYWGFGISIVTNKGNRGQDFTGFIVPGVNFSLSEYSKISPILTGDASIFGSFGLKLKYDIILSGRLGFYTKKYIYNGKGDVGITDPIGSVIRDQVPNQEWFITKDGGFKPLYGLHVDKHFNSFSIGTSYDNFNGLMATVGLKFH